MYIIPTQNKQNKWGNDTLLKSVANIYLNNKKNLLLFNIRTQLC